MKTLKSSIDRQTALIESILRNMDIKADLDDFENNQKRRQSATLIRTNSSVILRNIMLNQFATKNMDEENEI